MTNLIAFTVGLGAVVVAALTLDAVMRHQDRIPIPETQEEPCHVRHLTHTCHHHRVSADGL